MTPTAARRHRAVLAERLRVDSYFGHDPEALALVLDAVDKAINLMARPVVFRWLGQEGRQDVFEVGRGADTTRVLKTAQRSIWWLWAALDDRQRTATLRCSDFSAPWATFCDDSARRALRNGTIATFRRWGVPELEVAAKHITVSGGLMRYDPPANAPAILTQ